MEETSYVFQQMVIYPVERVIYILNSWGQHYKKLEPLMSDRLLWSTTTSWHFGWLLAEGLAVLHVSQRREEFLKLT